MWLERRMHRALRWGNSIVAVDRAYAQCNVRWWDELNVVHLRFLTVDDLEGYAPHMTSSSWLYYVASTHRNRARKARRRTHQAVRKQLIEVRIWRWSLLPSDAEKRFQNQFASFLTKNLASINVVNIYACEVFKVG